MKFLDTARRLNIFDWFGLYKPLLDSWRNKGLEVLQVSLPEKFIDPIPFRIELRIKSESGQSFTAGYGEDTSESRAFEKAICELHEREVFLSAKNLVRHTTSGVAAHRFPSLAKKSAQAELIERDAFLRHWLTQTPFERIQPPKSKETASFDSTLKSVGHVAHVFRTHLGVRPTIVVAIENESSHGFVVGSSGTDNENAAIRKALREAFYNLAMERVERVDWNKKDLLYHREYWYERAQFPEWMRANFSATTNSRKSKTDFEYEMLSDSPISVVAAFSDQLIDLWVGDTHAHVLDRIRCEYGVTPNGELHPFP